METDKDLQQIKKRLLELARRSYSQSVYTFTPFLGLSEQQAYHEISGQLAYAGCGMEGGSPLSERKMIKSWLCGRLPHSLPADRTPEPEICGKSHAQGLSGCNHESGD